MVLVHLVYGNWSNVGYSETSDQAHRGTEYHHRTITRHACTCKVGVVKAENHGHCYGQESRPFGALGRHVILVLNGVII